MKKIFTLCILCLLTLPFSSRGNTGDTDRQDTLDTGLTDETYDLDDLMSQLHRASLRHHRHQAYSIRQWYHIHKLLSYLQQEHIPSHPFDITSDTSMTKYVGGEVRYTQPIYKPNGLVVIRASAFIALSRNSSIDTFLLRPEAHEQLIILATAFHSQFGTPLKINSTRRSYHEQQNRFDPACYAAGICALPATSEHQSGLAVDIGNLWEDKYARVQDHAHLYGYHQSYQKGKDIDGLLAEPRHWRYLGIPLATELYEKQLTFSEWYRMNNSNKDSPVKIGYDNIKLD